MVKKKFILEFDEMPKYIIVSNGRHPEVYEDGEKIEGLISVEFRGAVDEAPTIRLEKFGMRLGGQ